jgi:hypothetical protein
MMVRGIVLLAAVALGCGGGALKTGPDGAAPGDGHAGGGGSAAGVGGGGAGAGGGPAGAGGVVGSGGKGAAGGTAGSGGAIAGAGGACAFDATYTFHDDGGLRLYADSSKLTPPRTHAVTRTPAGGGAGAACMRDIPCVSASGVGVADIEAAIASSDVQAALAKPKGALYGTDTRPVDGTVWIFERDDGRDFTVGSGNAVPAGLRALETLLKQLETETLAAPECAQVANPRSSTPDASSDASSDASCAAGCTSTTTGVFCNAGETQWTCTSGKFNPTSFNAYCRDAGTNAIRYCCPPSFMPLCD